MIESQKKAYEKEATNNTDLGIGNGHPEGIKEGNKAHKQVESSIKLPAIRPDRGSDNDQVFDVKLPNGNTVKLNKTEFLAYNLGLQARKNSISYQIESSHLIRVQKPSVKIDAKNPKLKTISKKYPGIPTNPQNKTIQKQSASQSYETDKINQVDQILKKETKDVSTFISTNNMLPIPPTIPNKDKEVDVQPTANINPLKEKVMKKEDPNNFMINKDFSEKGKRNHKELSSFRNWEGMKIAESTRSITNTSPSFKVPNELKANWAHNRSINKNSKKQTTGSSYREMPEFPSAPLFSDFENILKVPSHQIITAAQSKTVQQGILRNQERKKPVSVEEETESNIEEEATRSPSQRRKGTGLQASSRIKKFDPTIYDYVPIEGLVSEVKHFEIGQFGEVSDHTKVLMRLEDPKKARIRYLISRFRIFTYAMSYRLILLGRIKRLVRSRSLQSQDFYRTDAKKIMVSSRNELAEIIQSNLEEIESATYSLDFRESSNLPLSIQTENYDRAIDYCLDLLDILIEHICNRFSNVHMILMLSKLI